MKKILVLLCAIMIVGSLCACGESVPSDENSNTALEDVVKEQVKDNVLENIENVEKTLDNLSMSKSEKAAYEFLVAIQSCDYETAYNMLDIEDKSFVTLDDFIWFIPRSDFAELEDTTYELLSVDSLDGNTENISTFDFADVNVQVNTRLNDENQWKVVFADFYVKDWVLKIPKGMDVTVNGIAVTSEYLDREEESFEYYKIPNIVQKEATLIAVSDVLGSFEEIVTPTSGEYRMVCRLDEVTSTAIYEELRNLLNTLNELYENGGSMDDFASYVSDEAVTSTLEGLYDAVSTGHKGALSSLNPTDVEFTIIKGTDKEESVAAFLNAEDMIALNVMYEKTWKVKGHPNIAHSYASLVVQKTEEGLKVQNYPAANIMLKESLDVTMDW